LTPCAVVSARGHGCASTCSTYRRSCGPRKSRSIQTTTSTTGTLLRGARAEHLPRLGDNRDLDRLANNVAAAPAITYTWVSAFLSFRPLGQPSPKLFRGGRIATDPHIAVRAQAPHCSSTLHPRIPISGRPRGWPNVAQEGLCFRQTSKRGWAVDRVRRRSQPQRRVLRVSRARSQRRRDILTRTRTGAVRDAARSGTPVAGQLAGPAATMAAGGGDVGDGYQVKLRGARTVLSVLPA
jgi:hypothetical protein